MPYVIASLIALVVCTIIGAVVPAVVTYILIGLCSLFLICLVLIQRGRGGGLAGAFGGAGGSSAFGTRAGDVFTRITIVTASVWIALSMGLVINANAKQKEQSAFAPDASETEDAGAAFPIPSAPGGEEKATTGEAPTAPESKGQGSGLPPVFDESAPVEGGESAPEGNTEP